MTTFYNNKNIMRATLKRLSYENFKGRTMSVCFPDGRAVIRGTNEAGKSTLCNAFHWLMEGVDSQGRTNYELYDATKPLTPENAVPASVEAVWDIDGRELVLKRTAKQKWVRKRGSDTYEKNDSDEYVFYVDGLAVPAGTYWASVEQFFAPIDKLKIMLNIRHYLSLEWKVLRRQFSDIVGDVTEGDLKGDYSDIDQYLDKFERNLDKTKEYLKQQKVPVDAQLKKIAASIDGAESVLPSLEDVGWAEAQIEAAKIRIAEIDAALEDAAKANEPYIEKRKKELEVIESLKRSLSEERSKWDAEQIKPVAKLTAGLVDINNINEEIAKRNAASAKRGQALETQLELARESYEVYSKERDRLAALKDEIKSRVFKEDMVCPTCGQNYPEEFVEAAREKFYAKRDDDLRACVESGIKARDMRDSFKAQAQKLMKELEDYPEPEPLKDITVLAKMCDDAKSKIVPFEQSIAYGTLKAEIESKEASLTVVPELDATVTASLTKERSDLRGEIERLRGICAKKTIREESLVKIAKMRESQSASLAESARLERLIEKCVERDREWASIISERANAFLHYSRVAMTEFSKGGDITDICKLTARDVSAGTQNTATQILIGIDVALCFQKWFGIELPVFIDNAEQIVSANIPEMDNQLVMLYVDENYPELTIV